MSGKKILMLCGEFTEEYEIFVFQQGMEAVGHTVHVICPDKKAGEMIQTSLHDFEGHQTYIERFGHLAEINKTFPKSMWKSMTPYIARAGGGLNIFVPTSEFRPWCGISTRRKSRSSPYATACRSWWQSMEWCAAKRSPLWAPVSLR